MEFGRESRLCSKMEFINKYTDPMKTDLSTKKSTENDKRKGLGIDRLFQSVSFQITLIFILERPSISWIKNSIKPNRVQHILRHIYYATMQKLCKFEALYRPKIQCKSHKGNP